MAEIDVVHNREMKQQHKNPRGYEKQAQMQKDFLQKFAQSKETRLQNPDKGPGPAAIVHLSPEAKKLLATLRAERAQAKQ